MCRTIGLLAALIFILATVCAGETEAKGRERLSMDFDWKFALGHLYDMDKDYGYRGDNSKLGAHFKTADTSGPARADFDDSRWGTIDLPHDWAMGLEYDKAAERFHGYKKIGVKYPANSVGWYRKSFEIPQTDLNRRLSIQFDGVFRNSRVWLNGHLMARQPSGYTSFAFDITDYANYGRKNTLVVRVDASGSEMENYEGAGLYRHVWLTKTEPLHVAECGTFVTSQVKQTGGKTLAVLTVKTTLANEQDKNASCKLVSTIFDAGGANVGADRTARTINAWESDQAVQSITVEDAKLWSVESPYLYGLTTTIKQDGRTVDTYRTTFGMRTIEFDANEGFLLNGKPTKLKGVCCHQQWGGLGTAVPDRIWDFQIESLKAMGANAYRCSHNQRSPEFLDACDRLGMLVLDEVRTPGSTQEYLGQLETMIRRDRNHPSIILWSLGNEEWVIQDTVTGARLVKTMKRLVHRLDPTRLVTLAMNGGWGSPVSKEVDVQGCQYGNDPAMDALHRKLPQTPIIQTESCATLSTRGIYENDRAKGYYAAYDTKWPDWWGDSSEIMWSFCAKRKWLGGTFVWTGFDYFGEPSPCNWPQLHSNFGIMDRVGFPKDNYYYYKSWWSGETVLHVLPHWNWEGKEGKPIDVWCHSNCEEIELIVNGQSCGRKKMPRNLHLQWEVTYNPGYIEARGYNGGKEVCVGRRETTGEAAAIRLIPDRAKIRADNRDVSLVTVEIVDAKGRLVPTANNKITFTVSDNGKILGVDNGDPSCRVVSGNRPCQVFGGLLQVIVQSGQQAGAITLKARTPDIREAEVTIDAEVCTPEPFVLSLQAGGV